MSGMASKFGLAGGIPERRVRPIWDAIDSRQFKNALKHCTNLLSKHPNSPYALALKALILERMGKADEALSVCLNAKELLYTNDFALIDDLTLSTLQIVFQRLDHLDVATSCYEYACGKFPNNMELMIGLFNCYVREYSYVKQQQIAIKMYKIAGEERFLLWAVCSIQLQVLCGNGGEKLLLLAEGLLKKHITSHSLHEPEALILYISLLEQQSKYGDALEVLSGNLGSLIMIEVDRLRLQGRLHARAGDYDAASNIFQEVLRKCPDDWECFLHYLGCLMEDDSSLCSEANSEHINLSKSVDCKISHLTDEVFDSRIANASSFVHQLLAEANSDSIRCPYLANLEIERRKLLNGKGDSDKLVETLVHYFLRFGHLACFASDVEMFLQVLSHDNKCELLKKLMKECQSIETVPTKALGKFITVFKIQNIVGELFTLPIDELEKLAVQMTDMYCKNLTLSKDLDGQDSMYGEELLSMACNVLVQLFWRTRNLGYLLESVLVLEFGLTVRRFVWQYKILLLHLYSHWCSLPLAYEWYKSLDVKNILLETVSHLILPQMLASPLWADSSDILRDYLKFMDDHLKESADLTFLAYRHRNYSKVIEFVQFKERLQRSSQYLMARIEAPILQMKQKANSIEEEESILESLKSGVQILELSNETRSKPLTFNEDLQLRPWWTPTCDKNYLLGPSEGVSYCPRENMHKQIQQSDANVIKNIEKRSLLPRMVFLSMRCAASSVKENIEVNGSVFNPKLSSELKLLLDQYANTLGFSFQDALELAFGVSSGHKQLEELNVDLVGWMSFVVFLNAWNLQSHEVGKGSNTPNMWQLVNSLLKKCIEEKIRSIGPHASAPGSDLSTLVQLVTEPLAWHTLVIQSCARSVVPSGKRKKKGGAAAEQSNARISQGIQESVQSMCNVIQEVLNWLKEQISKSDDAKLESVLSSLHGQSEGPGKVFQIINKLASSANDMELGDRISQAVQSWSPADVVRKITTSQVLALHDFSKICESKLKSLQALKAHL
nr:N-terminal acetyltransferase B complex auxiliary subunit NAA25 [Ipomoea batatas]